MSTNKILQLLFCFYLRKATVSKAFESISKILFVDFKKMWLLKYSGSVSNGNYFFLNLPNSEVSHVLGPDQYIGLSVTFVPL